MCAAPHLGINTAANQFFHEILKDHMLIFHLVPSTTAMNQQHILLSTLFTKHRRCMLFGDAKVQEILPSLGMTSWIAKNSLKSGRNVHFDLIAQIISFSPVLCSHSCRLHLTPHEGRYEACITHCCILSASPDVDSQSIFE